MVQRINFFQLAVQPVWVRLNSGFCGNVMNNKFCSAWWYFYKNPFINRSYNQFCLPKPTQIPGMLKCYGHLCESVHVDFVNGGNSMCVGIFPARYNYAGVWNFRRDQVGNI